MDRDTILEAAAQIFSEKGFHAASMQDIAAAVSLQKASLYHHVSSKQEILQGILDKALDLLIERMGAVLEKPLPDDEKLRLAMASYLHTLLEHRDLASVLLLEHRSLDEPFKARHIPRRTRFESMWRGLIQDGIEAGLFCCVDPGLSARAVLGLMNSTLSWYRPEGALTPDDIAGGYWKLVIQGLKVRTEEAHGASSSNL